MIKQIQGIKASLSFITHTNTGYKKLNLNS